MDSRKRHSHSHDDIFSKLPDTIFHDILSLLPTKDLVRTSVLSSRWRSLWIYTTNIDLHCNKTMNPSFVEKLLLSLRRCDPPYLQKIRVSAFKGIAPFHVASWISSAIELRVHQLHLLDLRICNDANVVLSRCFFSCESLTSVKLFRSCFSEIPSSICLPNLNILHLCCANFLDEQSTQQFFSSLPVLQELDLSICKWGKIRKLTVHSPTLKSLSISNEESYDIEINVYASNLRSFHCQVNVDFDLVLHDMEFLVDASIQLDDDGIDDDSSGINLLRQVHRAKSLTVSDHTLGVLHLADNLEARLPTFYNLKHLVVDSKFFYYDGLSVLLKRAPNLEFLDIAEGMSDFDNDFEAHKSSLKSDSLCFKWSLRKLRISSFTGDESDMFFLYFMMKNAPLLKNIELIRKSENILLPQGSSSCVIQMS